MYTMWIGDKLIWMFLATLLCCSVHYVGAQDECNFRNTYQEWNSIEIDVSLIGEEYQCVIYNTPVFAVPSRIFSNLTNVYYISFRTGVITEIESEAFYGFDYLSVYFESMNVIDFNPSSFTNINRLELEYNIGVVSNILGSLFTNVSSVDYFIMNQMVIIFVN